MKNAEQILHEVRTAYHLILGANLAGIYVHGSLAFDCFHWEISDIDYIAVVHEPLSLEDKLQIMEKTVLINSHAPLKGIEMSVVLKNHCIDFVYPTPYELHFSNMYLEQYYSSPQNYCRNMCGKDTDLAAHFTVTRNRGIVLCGPPVEHIFGSVDIAYYLDSIKLDIANAEQDVINDPIYVILNLCRVAAYIEDGLILSKPGGGKWALLHTPKEYHQLLQNAVESYELAYSKHINMADAVSFCKYILPIIF